MVSSDAALANHLTMPSKEKLPLFFFSLIADISAYPSAIQEYAPRAKAVRRKLGSFVHVKPGKLIPLAMP